MNAELELKKIINEIREDAGRDQVTDILDQSNLREDLDFDSLELAVLTVRLEARFRVDVFEDGMVQTVGEVLQKISKKAEF